MNLRVILLALSVLGTASVFSCKTRENNETAAVQDAALSVDFTKETAGTSEAKELDELAKAHSILTVKGTMVRPDPNMRLSETELVYFSLFTWPPIDLAKRRLPRKSLGEFNLWFKEYVRGRNFSGANFIAYTAADELRSKILEMNPISLPVTQRDVDRTKETMGTPERVKLDALKSAHSILSENGTISYGRDAVFTSGGGRKIITSSPFELAVVALNQSELKEFNAWFEIWVRSKDLRGSNSVRYAAADEIRAKIYALVK